MTAGAPASADCPDEALLLAFRAGDDAAFASLYARYNRRVTTYALRLLGTPQEAEEVCTEAFLRVVEGRGKPATSVAAWLFTVVHRLCLDRLRTRSRRQRLLTWFGWSPAPLPSPDDGIEDQVRDRRLARAVEALSDEHRAVVGLTYTEGLASADVAAILGLTDQQVRSRLTYARKLLRDALGDPDDL